MVFEISLVVYIQKYVLEKYVLFLLENRFYQNSVGPRTVPCGTPVM